jgi:aldose sugar dehydrogenase
MGGRREDIMIKARLGFALAAVLALAAPALAQNAPPKPSADQLAAVFKEDQLSDEKCGAPRNAGDEYRPAPLMADQTRAPRITTKQKFHVETVAKGLPNAWGFAFLPSGNILVTIRGSGLRIITPDGKVSDTLPGSPFIKSSIPLFGMHDVVLDKDFAKTRTIYLAYVSTPAGGGNTGYIASAKLAADDKSITDLRVLKEETGMVPRRVVQAKDGSLFAITADIITPYISAQSPKSPNGKVLHINADGTAPKTNPYFSTADADPTVYAVGVRDPQGMALRPGTNDLWIIENEPRGGDELNRIQLGKNYGFPLISYGRDNDGKLLNNGLTKQDGLEQPVYFWTPSVAFAGMAFYTGDKMPGWKNSVFMGGLSGMQLVRLQLNAAGRVVGEEKLLRDRCERFRDVREGPDGLIYVLTDAPAGELLRLSPG